jgi:hypothetical protein
MPDGHDRSPENPFATRWLSRSRYEADGGGIPERSSAGNERVARHRGWRAESKKTSWAESVVRNNDHLGAAGNAVISSPISRSSSFR